MWSSKPSGIPFPCLISPVQFCALHDYGQMEGVRGGKDEGGWEQLCQRVLSVSTRYFPGDEFC